MKIIGVENFTRVMGITTWSKFNGVEGVDREPFAWDTIYIATTNGSATLITNWIGEAISTSPNIPNIMGNRVNAYMRQTIVDSESTFYNHNTLTNCSIGNSVLFINNSMINTFYGCSNLIGVDIIPNSVTDMTRTFQSCTKLVNAPTIGANVINMYRTFYGCSNLVNAPTIPNSVTDMTQTFQSCSNLVNAPAIPNSVTDMGGTFQSCSNLVNAPTIGANVTNMQLTFYGCTKLVNAPAIPNSVTDMIQTFQSCSNLVNAPAIPNSVTDMYRTFYGCTNLAGNITVVSTIVSNFTRCFNNCNASIAKNLRCPTGSATYNLAMNVCNGKNGVTVVAY
jgi:hypothetical protein